MITEKNTDETRAQDRSRWVAAESAMDEDECFEEDCEKYLTDPCCEHICCCC